jgi:hypothetical protein
MQPGALSAHWRRWASAYNAGIRRPAGTCGRTELVKQTKESLYGIINRPRPGRKFKFELEDSQCDRCLSIS